METPAPTTSHYGSWAAPRPWAKLLPSHCRPNYVTRIMCMWIRASLWGATWWFTTPVRAETLTAGEGGLTGVNPTLCRCRGRPRKKPKAIKSISASNAHCDACTLLHVGMTIPRILQVLRRPPLTPKKRKEFMNTATQWR